jgi:hypothetical protein
MFPALLSVWATSCNGLRTFDLEMIKWVFYNYAGDRPRELKFRFTKCEILWIIKTVCFYFCLFISSGRSGTWTLNHGIIRRVFYLSATAAGWTLRTLMDWFKTNQRERNKVWMIRSTVVEYSTQYPKIKGLNPASVTRREIMAKIYGLLVIIQLFFFVIDATAN